MSNLNIPKEYYINFPIKYLGTKARIETRYKINYIPSSEYENRGDYEITLQLKGTWLLEKDPIAVSDFLEEIYADEFCYDLYANAEAGQSSIELIIPFLDTKLKASLESNKKITFGLYNGEVLNFALVNEKWLDFPLPSTTEGSGDDVVYWKKQIELPKHKEQIPFTQGTGGMDIEFKNNKVIFKNILQTNRPLTLNSTLILRAYDSALPVGDDELMCRMYFRDDEQSLPTLSLEDTIGNFSVINPNNTTIDYYDDGILSFLAKINAPKINSFCMNIYNDNYELIYSSGWVSGYSEVVPDTEDTEVAPNIPVYNILGEVIGKFSKTTGQFNYNSVIISDTEEERDLIFHYPDKNYLYNNEILEYEIFSGLNLDNIFSQTSTKRLYYNFNLSEYSVQEAYNKPFYTTKDYVIELAKPIEIKLCLEGKDDVLTPKTELDNTINKFIGNYSQSDNIPIDYYSFYLYDEYENLISSKEEIYSENIFYEYDAFEYGKKYSLKFFVRNKKGQTSQRFYDLVVKFPNYISISDNLYSYGNPNIKNNGVALLIEDKELVLENIISVLETDPTIGKLNFTLLRKEVNSNVSVNIYSSEINNEFLKQLKVSNSFLQNYFPNFSIKNTEDFYGLIDYSAKNNKNYIYNFYLTLQSNEDILSSGGTVIVPSGVNLLTFQNTNSVSVLTHWDNYVLYPLLKSANDFCLCLDDDNNVISWKFGLNCEENEIVLNQDKTMFTTFDTKPKVIMGNLNYYSGSLKCLLGEFIENNSYYEPNSLLKSWEDFLKNSSCGLFKNPKGDAFIVFVQNNSTRSYMNEIANEYLYDGELSVKPTTISFNYIEIDKINEKLYVQLGD